MDYDVFQQKASETAQHPEDGFDSILYCAIGLAEEASEVLNKVKLEWTEQDEKKVALEISDNQWYSSQLCKHLGVSFSEVNQDLEPSPEREFSYDNILDHSIKLSVSAGEVLGVVKKVWRNDKGILSEEKKSKIIERVQQNQKHALSLASDLGYSFSDIAEMNYKKLQDRLKRNVICSEGDNR
jgi:NTP pyrophosphatase (non-canonical NTP hydrolase)